MVLQTIRRKITVAEFQRMGDIGIFHNDERLELIDGEIIKMTPIGSRHAYCVNRMAEFLITHLGNRAMVSTQNPVCLGKYSEPQPDIAIIKRTERKYMTSHPDASDVYLIIEFADSSINFDHDVKLPAYAKAGIQEVWIVDLISGCIEIYQEPTTSGYKKVNKKKGSDTFSPSSFPDITIIVNQALGRITETGNE